MKRNSESFFQTSELKIDLPELVRDELTKLNASEWQITGGRSIYELTKKGGVQKLEELNSVLAEKYAKWNCMALILCWIVRIGWHLTRRLSLIFMLCLATMADLLFCERIGFAEKPSSNVFCGII